jgi:hypothetical protein
MGNGRLRVVAPLPVRWTPLLRQRSGDLKVISDRSLTAAYEIAAMSGHKRELRVKPRASEGSCSLMKIGRVLDLSKITCRVLLETPALDVVGTAVQGRKRGSSEGS